MPNIPLNSSFYTSFLFLVPALYAHNVLKDNDVTIASITLTIVSALNHYYQCQNQRIQQLDRVAVRTIALVYLIHVFVNFHAKFCYAIMLFAVITGTFYAYIQVLSLGHVHECHYMLHFVAVFTVMLYIYGRKQCESD